MKKSKISHTKLKNLIKKNKEEAKKKASRLEVMDKKGDTEMLKSISLVSILALILWAVIYFQGWGK